MTLHQQAITKPLYLSLTVLLLAACGGNPQRTIFNDANPSMESLLAVNASQSINHSREPVTRSEAIAHNGTTYPNQNVFRELENPTLILYIEPHVTRSGTYIPGMTVPYKLYQQVEFALPGEW